MEICAIVANSPGSHRAHVRTGGVETVLDIAAKPAGGSAVNGGELLLLALATCYCNDLYREAARLGLTLDEVHVDARADFDGVGVAASNVRYRATVKSSASASDIERLLRETDAVAEVHNTLRKGVAVERRDSAA